jgi:hypothetical protein
LSAALWIKREVAVFEVGVDVIEIRPTCKQGPDAPSDCVVRGGGLFNEDDVLDVEYCRALPLVVDLVVDNQEQVVTQPIELLGRITKGQLDWGCLIDVTLRSTFRSGKSIPLAALPGW